MPEGICFTKKAKKLISQLHHIVSDFGILLPMGIYNLEDIRLNNNGSDATSFSIVHPLHHRMTVPQINIAGVLPMEMITIKGNPNTPAEYKEKARLITNSNEMVRLLSVGIYQMTITQESVRILLKKINTMLKLRMIDIRICSILKNPPVSDNNSHIALYNNLPAKILPTLTDRVRDYNLVAFFNPAKPRITIRWYRILSDMLSIYVSQLIYLVFLVY